MTAKQLKEHLKLLALVVLAFVLIYFVPQGFNKVIFLIFPVLFLKSKKNYLWIAFLFVLLEQPGGLFFGGTVDDPFRLPLYNISAGISFSFEQIMILIALYKAVSMHQKFNPFFKKPLFYLFIYFILLVFLSIFMGMSFANYRMLFRNVVNLTLFYSIFFLMRDKEDWKMFFTVIFPFVFFALLFQIFSLINGYQLIHLFRPGILSTQGVVGKVSQGFTDRPIEMVHFALISFIASLFYLSTDKKYFNRSFLITVNTISFVTIFLTATRTWVISMIFAYLLYVISSPKQIGRQILRFGLAIFLIFTLASFSIIDNQFGSAFDRIMTLELFAKGDITAGGTAQRFDRRAPKVIAAFEKGNMLFGSGFSDHYYKYADSHVGFHNFLFNAGIIGSFLLLLFILIYFNRIISLFLMLKDKNIYKKSILIFAIAITAILILQSSTQFIGYDVSTTRVLTLSLLLYFSSTIYNKAIANI